MVWREITLQGKRVFLYGENMADLDEAERQARNEPCFFVCEKFDWAAKYRRMVEARKEHGDG